MRTDTERLNWLLDATETQSYDAGERLQAAFTLGLSGRTALDAAMGAKLVKPGEPMPELTALDLAVAELGRIRNVKGFSEERDDGYVKDELALAATAYLRSNSSFWPYSWNITGFKPSPDDRKKELTKGIALALCELDRLIRAERRESQEMEAAIGDGAEGLAAAEVSPGKFKVGDRVRVARCSPWHGWMSEMDAYVGDGEIYEVTELASGEARVAGWYFPKDCLEHADD